MAAKNQHRAAKPFSMIADALESAAESFEEATANAPDSARRAARVTKRALGAGVYKAFYGLSFGIVYSGVFITELLPEKSSVRRALVEGAEAAIVSRQKSKRLIKAGADHVVPPTKAKSRAKTAGAVRKVAKKRADRFDAAMENGMGAESGAQTA